MSEEIQSMDESQDVNVSNAQNEVDMPTYEATRNDMHKFKRKYLETAKETEALKARLQELEENQLKNTENYKELWEKEKSNSQTWQGKYQSITQKIVENEKIKAITNEALKKGFNEEFLDVLEAFDTSDVLVETTDSGKFIVNGADTWIDSLKASKPSMFVSKSDPKINNKSGNYDGREKTYSMKEVLELQRTNPAKYSELVTTKRHLITK